MTNFECDYIYTNQKNEWEENIKLYVYKSSYNFYLRCYQTAKIKKLEGKEEKEII